MFKKEKKNECRLTKMFTEGYIYLALRNVIRFQLEKLRLDLVKINDNPSVDYNYWGVKIWIESDEKIEVLAKGDKETLVSFEIVFRNGWMDNMSSLKRSVEKSFSCPSKSVNYIQQEPKKFKQITSLAEIL